MKIRAMLGGLCLLLILQFAGCDRVTPSVPNSAETGSSHELRVAPEDRNQGFMLQSFVETPEGYFYGRSTFARGESLPSILCAGSRTAAIKAGTAMPTMKASASAIITGLYTQSDTHRTTA